jgi:hypothetical protein
MVMDISEKPTTSIFKAEVMILMIETARLSETLETIYHTTKHHNPKNQFYVYYLKSHLECYFKFFSIHIPRVSHKKYSARAICRGADHIMLRYVVRSVNLWASTDMRFTISPTVDSFRAVFDMRKA